MSVLFRLLALKLNILAELDDMLSKPKYNHEWEKEEIVQIFLLLLRADRLQNREA